MCDNCGHRVGQSYPHVCKKTKISHNFFCSTAHIVIRHRVTLNMGISGFVLLTFIFSFFISHTTSSVFDEVNHHRYLKKSDIPEDIPFESPSNGTDIISHPVALIKCKNQTKCVQPALQLERKYNVYYCKRVSYGVRFYFLVREGLLLHPNLQMVESPQDADIVLYLPESAAWHKSECNNPNFAHKLVVMDGNWCIFASLNRITKYLFRGRWSSNIGRRKA